MRLTETAVAALKLGPDQGDIIVFDDAIPGLGIRLRKSGLKTWLFQYKLSGRTRRVTLGPTSAIKAGKARDIAADMYSRVRLGGDPASDRQQQVQRSLNTFHWLATQFLASHKGRPKTLTEVNRHLLQYCAPLHSTPMDAITRRHIADLLGKLDQNSGPASANRTRSTLSALFSWAMSEGLATANPVIGVTKRQERPRERILNDSELAGVWHAAGDDVYGTIIKLLILTAQRRGEIAGLTWNEIDLDRGVISLSGPDEEPSGPYLAHYADHSATSSRDSFGRRTPVPVRWLGYAKRNLDHRSGVANWVLHDLRRSVATGMADLGVQPHVVEVVLNHIGGFRAGVGGVYNRSPYEREKREALELWDRHIVQIVGA